MTVVVRNRVKVNMRELWCGGEPYKYTSPNFDLDTFVRDFGVDAKFSDNWPNQVKSCERI